MKNLIQKAIKKAMELHEGQVRKGDGKSPYVLHPLEVGIVISHYTTNQDLIAAAILHDTVEDCDYTLSKIKKEFNPEIAELVALMTGEKEGGWAERRAAHIEKLRTNRAAYIIKAVDTYTNMRELATVIREEGGIVWNRFNAPKELKMKYYQTILCDTKEFLPSDLLEKYVSALKDLEYVHLVTNKSAGIGFKDGS